MERLAGSWTAQIALSGLAIFGVCYATGRLLGPEEAKKKKQGGGRGGAPGGREASNNEYKLDRLFKTAEQFLTEGRFADAEKNYAEALALVETLDDPMVTLLENVFCMRLAVVCEKQHKYEEAEKYLLHSISTFEGRPLAPQELVEYSEVLERTVELCMSKLKNPEKAVRPLTLWLKVAEDLNNDQVALVCCNLLTKIKTGQGKLEDASQYGTRALAIVKRKGTVDDLGLSTMFQLIEVFHQQGKHEENKRLINELSLLASSITPPQSAASVTGSLAGWCFDHEYYLESQNLMARAIELSSSFGMHGDKEDLMQYENVIAQALAERGKLEEAREYTKRIASTLGGVSPPLTISKYLKTTDAVVLEEGRGVAVCHVKLHTREYNKLPGTALLVCKVDHPEAGQQPFETQQLHESDRPDINFRFVLPYVKQGYIVAQIDVFSDATKAHRLSTHFVLCHAENDIVAPAPQPSVVAAAVPVQQAEVTYVAPAEGAVPVNVAPAVTVEESILDGHRVVEAHIGDTTIVGTTDGETTVITAVNENTTIVEAITGDSVVRETIQDGVTTIEGTDGQVYIKQTTDGETTVIEETVGDTTVVEVIRNEVEEEEDEEAREPLLQSN